MSGDTLSRKQNERSRVSPFAVSVIPTEPARKPKALDDSLHRLARASRGQGEVSLRDTHPYPRLYEMAVALCKLNEYSHYIALGLATHTPPRFLPPPTLQKAECLGHFRRRSPAPDR